MASHGSYFPSNNALCGPGGVYPRKTRNHPYSSYQHSTDPHNCHSQPPSDWFPNQFSFSDAWESNSGYNTMYPDIEASGGPGLDYNFLVPQDVIYAASSSHTSPDTSPLSTPPPLYESAYSQATGSDRHYTYEVPTGEERAYDRYIHRLSNEERRHYAAAVSGPNSGPIVRPTFRCKIPGCGRWLMHRGQLKTHLIQHGMNFKKPYRCTCGAEFGRQVEAARHMDDKKLCLHCKRTGRKERTGRVCLRCTRDGKV